MKGNQWPLVVFTVLVQLAVGLFLVSGVVHYFLLSRFDANTFFIKSAVFGVIAILVVSMMISLFHLGSPKNAVRSILNLGSSWLSAEIALVLFFLIVATAYFLMLWLEMSVPGQIGFWCGSGTGLVLVYCMTRVYRLPTVPVWDSSATLVSFYRTSLLLGSVTTGGLLLVIHLVATEKMGLIFQLLHLKTTFYWIICTTLVMVVLDCGQAAVTRHRAKRPLRIVYSLIGLLSFSLSLFWAYYLPPNRWLAILLAGMAVVSLLISQLIDRRLFYSVYKRPGF